MKLQVVALINTALACVFAIARANPAPARAIEAHPSAIGPMMENADLLAMARSIRRA